MKKKLAFFFGFAVLIVVLLFATNVYAEPSADILPTKLGNSNTYYSYSKSTKTLTVSGEGATPDFTNTSGDTSSQPWFSWRSDGSIEHIVVKDGVTSLGNYFFFGVHCDDFSVSDTVESFGGYSFSCASLTKIALPKNLKYISNNAFYLCEQLSEISFPASLSSIGASAFENCTRLKKVEFEKMSTAVNIYSNAFLNCKSLMRVNVPLASKLYAYSFGYLKANANAMLDGFVLGVFSDSSALNYAKKYYVDYEFLNEMEIFETDSITRTYSESNVNEQMIYKFTPLGNAQYTFVSSGNIDVNCKLLDESKNELASCDDNSSYDLNFTIKYNLEKGKTYYFVVTSVNSIGDYTVSLSSVEIKNVSIDWDVTYTAADMVGKSFSVLEYIKTKTIDFEYVSGYIYKLPFNNGIEYSGMKIEFNNLLADKVTCGENKDSITVGDKTLYFTINIVHSYTWQVIEPTIKSGGYTLHTCVYCGDSYKDNFTDNLGQDVGGYVYLATSLNGDIDLSRPLENIEIFDLSGLRVARTDSNGYFYVQYAYGDLYFKNDMAVTRKITVQKGVGNLGNIALIYGDISGDGYINAKDFASVIHMKEYDTSESEAKNFDSNNDGVLEKKDWLFMKNFYTSSKLDTDTYDRF